MAQLISLVTHIRHITGTVSTSDVITDMWAVG